MSEEEKTLLPPGSAGGVQQVDPAAAPAAPDTMPGLQELLRLAELKAAEHHDAWLRAKADAENIRKRGQTDVANAYKYAVEAIAECLLPVRDALEAALAAENATAETLRSGAELTLKQLDAAFERANLVEINPAGQKFDPHQHQAIGMVDADGDPNCVVTVLQKGYRLHERIVRPALVTVSKQPQA